jgi:cation transport regulator ChaB
MVHRMFSDLPRIVLDNVPLQGQELFREAYRRALQQTSGDTARAETLAWEALRGEYFESANGVWERKSDL